MNAVDRKEQWRKAFLDCLRLAIDQGYFEDYETFDLNGEELGDLSEERIQMFQEIFGEPLY